MGDPERERREVKHTETGQFKLGPGDAALRRGDGPQAGPASVIHPEVTVHGNCGQLRAETTPWQAPPGHAASLRPAAPWGSLLLDAAPALHGSWRLPAARCCTSWPLRSGRTRLQARLCPAGLGPSGPPGPRLAPARAPAASGVSRSPRKRIRSVPITALDTSVLKNAWFDHSNIPAMSEAGSDVCSVCLDCVLCPSVCLPVLC